MMKIQMIPLCLMLGACALFPPTPEQLAAEAKAETTPRLCAATLVLSPAAIKAAQDELEARRATCDWVQAKAIAEVYLEQKEAQQQAAMAYQANMMSALSMSSQLLQQAGPRPMPQAPVTTNCHQMGMYWSCSSY